MEIIVLDYSNVKVSIIKKDSNMDDEEFLYEKGFDLSNCEWMSTDKIEIQNYE